MSQFSRRARWLNIFFPQSVAPAEQDPGVRSDDVSLVQPYDGGGFPLSEDTAWMRFLNPAAAAAGVVAIFTTPPDQLFRFMGADVQLIGGNGPVAGCGLQIQPPVGGGGIMQVTERKFFAGATANDPVNFEAITVPIIGPNTIVFMQWAGGNVATDLIVHVYGNFAPFGSVFYV